MTESKGPVCGREWQRSSSLVDPARDE